MNPEQIENRLLLKRLLIVIIAVILTVIFYPFIKKTFNLSSDDDWVEDAQAILDSAVKDSIEVVQGKIIREELEANFNADKWFTEFTANKVAFDRKYTGKQMDIYGEVENIGNKSGCAEVELKVNGYAYCKISLTNCGTDKNKWSNEIAEIEVGQYIHVRGSYAADDSNSSLLCLYDCLLYRDSFQIK